jgi:predicted metal-dependent hydrolase
MTTPYFITLSDGHQYPYQITPSSRAKHIAIKFSSSGELMVILPQRGEISLAHAFVQKKSAWVEKHIANGHIKPVMEIRPDSLDLMMLKEQWSVRYIESAQQGVEYQEAPDNTLIISGNIQSDALIAKIIGLFLKNKAMPLFTKMIDEIALQHGFYYSGVSIRGQKTRWGSCSSRQKLNLNYKLLFMPDAIVRYVFIHELCHTLEMNHSAKFWQLVEQYDPDYQQHRHYLKQHGTIIRHF